MSLVFSYVSPKLPGFSGWRFFRRKILLLPAITFVLTLFITPAIVTLPITPYKGPNEAARPVFGEESVQFTMYESNVAYTNHVKLYGSANLMEGYSVVITANLSQNDTLVTSIQLTLTPDNDERETSTTLAPGEYTVEFNESWYFEMEPTDDQYTYMQVSQEMTEEHFKELIDWDTARFVMIVSSFFVLLGGICVDTSSVEKEEKIPESIVYRSYDVE